MVQKDILLLLVGVVFGFFSAIILEVFKFVLERRKLNYLENQGADRSRSSELIEFLRGESPNLPKGHKPSPAWLRVVATKDRTLIAKLFESFKSAESTTARVVYAKDRNSIKKRESRISKIFDKQPEIDQDVVELEPSNPTSMLISEHPWKRYDGNKFLLGPSNIIGRSSKCDIVIVNDTAISRENTLIRYETDKYFIYDLGSTNGTKVNELKLDKNTGVALSGGEIIILGEMAFEFGCVDEKLPLSEFENLISQDSQDQFLPNLEQIP